jgi:hypothetical protein
MCKLELLKPYQQLLPYAYLRNACLPACLFCNADMNHTIHSCMHAHVAKDRPDGLTRAEQFGGMAAYLEALLDLLEPRFEGFC